MRIFIKRPGVFVIFLGAYLIAAGLAIPAASAAGPDSLNGVKAAQEPTGVSDRHS